MSNEFENENERDIEQQEVKENKNILAVILGSVVFEWVFAIGFAILLSFLIKSYVFTLVKVDGQSMEPTLHHNDRLFVNRLMYTPKKGDIIIFTPESDPKRPYVKRVIATEGDSVYIDFQKGIVEVNGEVIDEPYIKDNTRLVESYIDSLMRSGKYSRENPIKIDKGYIFAMGDNRNNSKDSRALGPVPVKDVMGKAMFRLWPMEKFGSLYD